MSDPRSTEQWSQEDIDADMGIDDDGSFCPDCDESWEMCECHAGEECGRWINGRLSGSCSKAGSEECDFECPYRNSLKF